MEQAAGGNRTPRAGRQLSLHCRTCGIDTPVKAIVRTLWLIYAAGVRVGRSQSEVTELGQAFSRGYREGEKWGYAAGQKDHNNRRKEDELD